MPRSSRADPPLRSCADLRRGIRSLVDVEAIKAAGFTVLVDNMWGNGAGFISRFIAGGATKVIEYHADRNPLFPEMKRPEPIPPNVDAGAGQGARCAPTRSASWTAMRTACGFWRREWPVRQPAPGLRPAGDVSVGDPRRARADRQVPQHDLDARQAGEAIRLSRSSIPVSASSTSRRP